MGDIPQMGAVSDRSIKCPVCLSDRSEFLFRDSNRRDGIDCRGTYVQCCECSLVYLSDPPSWPELARFYSAAEPAWTANSGKQDPQSVLSVAARPIPLWKSWLRKVRFRPHSWPLEAVPPGSKRILDLGCGNGAKLVEFTRRGYEVWGVDVSADAVALCRQILPEGHFFHGELQDTKLPDAAFDFIRVDNALEHLPNPKEVIRECFRLLCPGGTLLIYVPHGRSMTMRLMKGDSVSSWIPFHLQLFTRGSLTRLLRDAGFESVKIYGYSPVQWIPLSLIQRRDRHKQKSGTAVPSWLIGVCYPINWLVSKIGMAEELVGIGRKCSPVGGRKMAKRAKMLLG